MKLYSQIKEKTDFDLYKSGYKDGYLGEALQFPESDYYMIGYEEGKEDDQSGAQSKFDFDTRTIKHGVK